MKKVNYMDTRYTFHDQSLVNFSIAADKIHIRIAISGEFVDKETAKFTDAENEYLLVDFIFTATTVLEIYKSGEMYSLFDNILNDVDIDEKNKICKLTSEYFDLTFRFEQYEMFELGIIESKCFEEEGSPELFPFNLKETK